MPYSGYEFQRMIIQLQGIYTELYLREFALAAFQDRDGLIYC